MKCNYVRHSESNQTARQTERKFRRKNRESAKRNKISDFWLQGDKERLSDCLLAIHDCNFFLHIVNRCNWMLQYCTYPFINLRDY